jgi:hypothetical protein
LEALADDYLFVVGHGDDEGLWRGPSAGRGSCAHRHRTAYTLISCSLPPWRRHFGRGTGVRSQIHSS